MENFQVQDCPVPKIRLGKSNDGGYVVANTVGPRSQDLFLSGGISNDISFEESVLKHFQLDRCYAQDGTINKLPWNNDKVEFVQQNLGSGSGKTNNWIQYFADRTVQNAFVKIDIEGHEFRLLPLLWPQMSQVKQLVLEVHTPGDIRLHPKYFVGLDDIQNQDLQTLFRNLSLTHRLIHVHPNNGCATWNLDGVSMPNVFETTWLRQSDYPEYEWKPTPSGPVSSLDQKNVLHKPEYTCFQGYPFYK